MGLWPPERFTQIVWILGAIEGEAGESMAIGLQHRRPSLDGRIESLYDKNFVVAAGLIGKPLELVAAPSRVQVIMRHHHQQ